MSHTSQNLVVSFDGGNMENAAIIFLLLVVCFLEFADLGPQLNPFYDRNGSPINARREEDNRIRRELLRTLLDNIAAIEEHNRLFEAGEALFKMRLNKFAYEDPERFSRLRNGLRRLSESSRVPEGLRNFLRRAWLFLTPAVGAVQVLGDIDWRNIVEGSIVLDQQECASCWAFSTLGAVEGQIFKKTGQTIRLSEQNLIDCARREYGSYGCNGGSMEGAYKYMQDVGIQSAQSYPYEARQGVCRRDPALTVAQLDGFWKIQEGNETQLMEAVSAVGPVAVAMDASRRTFQFYSSGIYYDPQCSSTDLDHGVLVVGYGTTASGIDYWVVKNSYGPDWGEGGYFRLARNRQNHCGIATSATYPSLRIRT